MSGRWRRAATLLLGTVLMAAMIATYDAHMPAGAQTSVAQGDVNGDSVINSVDALCVLRSIAGMPATTSCPSTLPGADVNRDGSVTSVDSLCVLRFVAGLPATMNCPLQPGASPTPAPGSMTLNGTATTAAGPARNGATVTAYVGTTACGSTTVNNGSFSLTVAGAGQTAGCGTNGATVTFAIDGVLATPSRSFLANTTATHNLTQTFNPALMQLGLQTVSTAFSSPVFLTHAGDNSGRLFVVQQGGLIRIVQNGAILPQPFLDVSSLLGDSAGELGLLGLAFHPSYAQNGRFFIFHTVRRADGTMESNVLAEYRVSSNASIADAATRRVLLTIPDRFTNHNGGMIAFGPDGYLYVGTGDGGGGGDPDDNGQNRNSLLGKMLRIDVNGAMPYAVPSTNPFVGQANVRPEIWAYGLRNPWRWSFDRLTGDQWIADVGQNAREEVNLQPAGTAGGRNYGWNEMEGTLCYPSGSPCALPGMTLPVHEYAHGQTGCRSITGGYVYRGTAYPLMQGGYFFGDFCLSQLWALWRDGTGAWRSTSLYNSGGLMMTSFGEDQAGELYVMTIQGAVYRLTASAAP
jgi:glucose/arabinose dehydrogenase